MRPWHERRMVQICHHRHGLRTAAATAAGALILPLLSAADAHAVDRPVWDALAACESGGNWHAHTGNGLQGGLQFSATTWVAHGGAQFAPRADQASRREQIDIAQRVLADQGPIAWPVCSRRIGLYGAVTSGAEAVVQEAAHTLRYSAIRWTTLLHGRWTRHHCRWMRYGHLRYHGRLPRHRRPHYVHYRRVRNGHTHHAHVHHKHRHHKHRHHKHVHHKHVHHKHVQHGQTSRPNGR